LEKRPIHIVGELYRADGSGPANSNTTVYFLPAMNQFFQPALGQTVAISDPKRKEIINERRDLNRVFQTIYVPGDSLIGYGYYQMDKFHTTDSHGKILNSTILNPSAKTDSEGRFDIELKPAFVAPTTTYELISGQLFAVGESWFQFIVPIKDGTRNSKVVHEWNGQLRRVNVGRIMWEGH
jgi:hypothetical protein